MDNRLCTFLYLGTKTGRQGLPSQDPSPARGQMPPPKGGKRSILSKCLRPDFNTDFAPNEQELGEMTLSYYDSNENADYEFGEMTLTNSNENAVYEFGEMTLSNYDHNESSDYEFGEMTQMRMPTRSLGR